MWSYDELKVYHNEIFQHVILFKKRVVLVRQEPRMMNIKLNPFVKLELENIEKDGIHFYIRNLEWISNLVVVGNENGENLLCVDF